MKYRIMKDSAVYILAPIVLCNLIDAKYLAYFITVFAALIVVYSILTKTNEARVNLSGITFSAFCLILLSFRQSNQSDFQIYIYETYFFILCALGIILSNAFGKNIFARLYLDILRAKGNSSLNIWRNIRKRKLEPIFNKISLVVIVHLIILSLIKIYSITTYGADKYKVVADLEILVSILFLIIEIYIISEIITKFNKKNMSNNKTINNKSSKNKAKIKVSDSRVINLSQYKKVNK